MLLIIVFLVSKFDFKRNVLPIHKKKSFIFLGVLITLIAGFRFYVGADTANYVNDFKNIPIIDTFNLSTYEFSRFRPGFLLLASLSKTIWPNFLLFQLIVASISNYLILRFIWKRTSFPFICILFYFILNYIEFNFEIMREIVAVSFALTALDYYENRKYIKAIILYVLANLMHASALIVLLYIFIVKIRYSKKLMLIIGVTAISAISLYKILPDFSLYADMFLGYGSYGDKYLNRELNQDYNIYFYLFHFTKYCFLPIIMLSIVKGKYKYVGFVSIWIILGILSIYSYAFYRFNNYFSPFIWLLYAEGIRTICLRYTNMKRSLIFLFMIFTLYIYQRGLLSIDEYHGGYPIYERYFPYEMVGLEHNYNLHISDYFSRRGD